jgi:hypothetical protein
MEHTNKKKFCISVDGSAYSEYGFDLIFDELYKKGDIIILTHVCNNDKLTEIPFENQPKSIQSKYESKLVGKLPQSDFEVLIKDRGSDNDHALKIVNEIAKSKGCSVLIMGTHGHKGREKSNEISKGVIYLIKQVKVPTFLIKERVQRKTKENGGFTWLVCIEKSNTRSFFAFEFAVGLVDKDLDKIIGLNIVDGFKDTCIELQFNSLIKKQGIKQYSFEYIQKEKDVKIPKHICEIVNFGTECIDFLVVGHNPEKFNSVENTPLMDIIKSAKTNILFYS